MDARFVILIAAASLAAQAIQAQTVYKSTGPDGNIVYSDHPPASGKVDRTFTFVELPSSPVPNLPAADSAKALPVRAAQASGGITMYSATWCGYCKRAKAYMAKKGIAYTNIDIDTADGRAAFARAGKGGVPLLFAGTRRIRGFTPEGYDAFFAGR